MKQCNSCNRPVISGYILCKECAEKPKPDDRDAVSSFVDRLAEDIVLDNSICACRMCAIGQCGGQVSGLTCRQAVKAWLMGKAEEYAKGD